MSSLKLKYLQYLDMLLNMSKSTHFNKSIEEISKDVHISLDLIKNICIYHKFIIS